MSGSGDSAGDARWRVFISHTSELRNFPRAMSYVAAVERAVSAAGHVIVDMADFAAASQPPAGVCAEMVRGCDVYVGVLGTRYGSPVRDQQEVSYTELEFATATEAGLDRLVFLLDTAVADVGIPPSELIDREFGARQDAFRRRVQDSGLLTRSFANPAELGQLAERALGNLAQTRQRVGSGIRREQFPAEPQPVRASKFVNPPPARRCRVQLGQQIRPGLEPGRLLRDIPHHHGRGLTAPSPAASTAARLGQVPQRALHQLPEPGRARERPGDQAAVPDPAAERILPRPELAVDQPRRRDPQILSVGVQQEHQPVQARLGRGAELQLGVRHLRHVPHRGAVPGAQDPQVHPAAPHPVRAQPRGDLIGGRETGHVHDHVPGRRDRPLRRGHIRGPPRELPQLRGMRQEHPPPAAVTGIV
ncbi:MAG TPA: DUF4062 domain-containing protein [Streptosporangiaceae bacterium]|nr:DUF4062 domain-containing protein [Streptosporangiaceae bacterium]